MTGVNNISPSPLLSIVAYARAGALEKACAMFLAAGLERVDHDPAVLSLRGRLLKDRARAAAGGEQVRLYHEAADAYARAGEIGGATYPLINAATLSLLAGRREQSQAFARQVLERIARNKDEPETPYYRMATQAEARLLLGDTARARKDFARAVRLAPQAYEDHASTLRQFALILGALGEETSWLDAHRPPRCLHFAGHMALAAGGASLAKRIRAVIAGERIGFGYGALAAGADILIAEALLESGAELDIVLPAPVTLFREVSVARFGADWQARFDEIVKAVHDVRAIESPADPASPLAIRLAAEVAMGAAVMRADTLTTEALQLLILDGKQPAAHAVGGSGWIGAFWRKSGRRQSVLSAPRDRSRRAPAPRTQLRAGSACLAAMLRIDLSASVAQGGTVSMLQRLARALSAAPKPLIAPRWSGETLLVAFASPGHAARAALLAKAVAETELRIAAHYAIVERAVDPFDRKPFLSGPATALPARMLLSVPAGAVHVSEDFAAALSAGGPRNRPHIEYVGDLPPRPACGPVRLYSLKP